MFQIRSPEVIYEFFENEAVVVHLSMGNYYSLQNTGFEIWKCLAQGFPKEHIFKYMAAQYQGDAALIQQQIQTFLQQLIQENLIAEISGNDVPSCFQEVKRVNAPVFTTPIFQKFTDMQELLILDPIHEVSDTGWPVTEKQKGNAQA